MYMTVILLYGNNNYVYGLVTMNSKLYKTWAGCNGAKMTRSRANVAGVDHTVYMMFVIHV